MTLEEFLVSPLRNAWIAEPGIAVYVRKAIRLSGLSPLACLDVANVEVEKERQRQGIFRNWLAKAERVASPRFECIYAENVHNEHLPAFLESIGYVPASYPDCWVKTL